MGLAMYRASENVRGLYGANAPAKQDLHHGRDMDSGSALLCENSITLEQG
jgi:hypothetical protein